MTKTDYKKQGKKNRAKGKAFETKVRKDLEKDGWIVDRWSNNVEFPEANIDKPEEERVAKLVPARNKFNPFTRAMMMGSGGMPDFIAFKKIERDHVPGVVSQRAYWIMGVECKVAKYLNESEKEKCEWLLSQGIFTSILIASPGEKRGKVDYREFGNA